MNKDTVKKHIEGLVSPFLKEIQAEIFELNLSQQGKTVMIELLVDKPQGGITIDECIYVNKQLNEQMELSQSIPDDYIVEVSSPGIDRPLKTYKDFQRVIGKKVRVHLLDKVDEKLEHHGVLSEINDKEIIINGKTKTICILFSNIQKGMQII